MLFVPPVTANQLATVYRPGAGANDPFVTQPVTGAKSVHAIGPLDGAIGYGNVLVKNGWAEAVGVVQAKDGWNLVALNASDAPLSLDGSVKLQRHTYTLAAIVGRDALATWTGKERIAELTKIAAPAE